MGVELVEWVEQVGLAAIAVIKEVLPSFRLVAEASLRLAAAEEFPSLVTTKH